MKVVMKGKFKTDDQPTYPPNPSQHLLGKTARRLTLIPKPLRNVPLLLPNHLGLDISFLVQSDLVLPELERGSEWMT